MTLALQRLAANDRAGFAGDGGGVVVAVVVVNKNAGVGQRGLEGFHDVADCASFVVAGDQHRDVDMADRGRQLLADGVKGRLCCREARVNIGVHIDRSHGPTQCFRLGHADTAG